MIGEIDATDWEPEGTEHLGTKRKIWLREPETDIAWLFKYVTFNETATGRYAKGDDWSERAVGLIAEELGIPTAVTELAFCTTDQGREDGVLVRTILDADSSQLVHGNELLAQLGLIIERPDREGYTIDNIRRSLQGVSAPLPYTDRFSAWDVFVGYLVLDAVCGNTDRHEENWAVVQGQSDQLAPSFDHASSLGFLLSDSDRAERLETPDRLRQVEAWAKRARTPFRGEPHPVDVALEAIGTVDTATRKHWIDAVSELSPDQSMDAIPPNRISETAREFASRLIRTNQERFLSQA